MTLLSLTPSILTLGGTTPLQLGTPTSPSGSFTALSSNTGVLWANTGREILIVAVGTTATTLTSDIPLLIDGEPVTGQSSGALTTSSFAIIGPFPSSFDRTDGTFDVEIDFSSQTNISVLLVRVPGAS